MVYGFRAVVNTMSAVRAYHVSNPSDRDRLADDLLLAEIMQTCTNLSLGRLPLGNRASALELQSVGP